jgi:ppGpp synthetase/RelA/SpoT-type nucleotidyltranferase
MSASREDISPELQRAMDGYGARLPLLKELAARLHARAGEVLDGLPRIDRVSFRHKGALSFGRKSLANEKEGARKGERKYAHPLADIEDQVAGRALVFFRRDIAPVVDRLKTRFNRVEQSHKAPDRHDAFAYESEHLVFIIPPDVFPSGWSELPERPTTFEMQVRTLFMHAWAEPQHDLSYKPGVTLTQEEKRQLAWAASSAWGGDAIFEQVLDSIAQRTGRVSNDTW